MTPAQEHDSSSIGDDRDSGVLVTRDSPAGNTDVHCDVTCGRQDFFEMIDDVRTKLARLANDSLLKSCFPEARLDAIRTKIAATNLESLGWGRQQQPFLFLRSSSDTAIRAFDDDLQLVRSHSGTNDKKILDFLTSESEDIQPWAGGVFELYVKATALRNSEALNTRLDWALPNGRRPDLMIDLGARNICIECTSLGESRASDERWRTHTDTLKVNPDKVFFERQDAYTQSRRMYAKVFDKIAPQFVIHRSQLQENGPNLLLISLNAVTSDLSARSPAIGWALDELFASQPTGNHSPASLCDWLLCQFGRAEAAFDELRVALTQVSGILVFDGCKFRVARINYNADTRHVISHAEMAAVERLVSVPPLYAQ